MTRRKEGNRRGRWQFDDVQQHTITHSHRRQATSIRMVSSSNIFSGIPTFMALIRARTPARCIDGLGSGVKIYHWEGGAAACLVTVT